MTRVASRRRQMTAALDRDLGRLYRRVEVLALPDRLKALLDQLETGPSLSEEKRT